MLLRTVAAILLGLVALVAQGPQRFIQDFAAAVKADDYIKQRELVSNNYDGSKDGFYLYEHEWCRLSLDTGDASKAASESVLKTLEGLASIYRVVGQKSDYLAKRFAWLSALSAEQKKSKLEMWDAVGRGGPQFDQARKQRKVEKLDEILPHFEEVVVKAEAAGDTFWGAQGHIYMAMMHELVPNWYEVVYHYKKAAEVGAKGHTQMEIAKNNLDGGMREAATVAKLRPELVDISVPLVDSKVKYKEALEKAAADAVAAGNAPKVPGSPDMPAGPMPNVHAVPIEWEDSAEFKIDKSGETPYLTPFGWVNGHWYWWPAIPLAKGTMQKASFLPGSGEITNDGGKVFLYPEGKQKTVGGGTRIKLAPKPELQEFKEATYLDGSKGKVWQTMMSVPTQFNFMGFNFGGNADSIGLKFRGATVAKGKLRGTDVLVHDVNGNGAFNDFGIDCIVTGKGKTQRVQPLSRYVDLDGHMFEIKIEANGRTLRSKPYDGPLGAVRLDWKGALTPAFLSCAGSGEDSTYYFDLMQAKDKAIWVVPGALSFQHGYIIEGRGDKANTIWITHGRSGVLNVQPSVVTTWKMGGAGDDGFTFVFKATVKKDGATESILIPAKEVKIYGAFGEQYESLMMGPPLPTVTVRKAKDGPVVATGKMKKPDNEDSRESADLIFLPKTLELKKDFSGGFEAKLEADYKPLGKINSAWTPGS
ncbi:MAG: hypothetical protein EXS14_02800 [Planctomycetes bacterium]|nr:hypothetical protein [Planctomycetota bacterium]